MIDPKEAPDGCTAVREESEIDRCLGCFFNFLPACRNRSEILCIESARNDGEDVIFKDES